MTGRPVLAMRVDVELLAEVDRLADRLGICRADMARLALVSGLPRWTDVDALPDQGDPS